MPADTQPTAAQPANDWRQAAIACGMLYAAKLPDGFSQAQADRAIALDALAITLRACRAAREAGNLRGCHNMLTISVPQARKRAISAIYRAEGR